MCKYQNLVECFANKAVERIKNLYTEIANHSHLKIKQFTQLYYKFVSIQ